VPIARRDPELIGSYRGNVLGCGLEAMEPAGLGYSDDKAVWHSGPVPVSRREGFTCRPTKLQANPAQASVMTRQLPFRDPSMHLLGGAPVHNQDRDSPGVQALLTRTSFCGILITEYSIAEYKARGVSRLVG
jgi:hypothetical protein